MIWLRLCVTSVAQKKKMVLTLTFPETSPSMKRSKNWPDWQIWMHCIFLRKRWKTSSKTACYLSQSTRFWEKRRKSGIIFRSYLQVLFLRLSRNFLSFSVRFALFRRSGLLSYVLLKDCSLLQFSILAWCPESKTDVYKRQAPYCANPYVSARNRGLLFPWIQKTTGYFLSSFPSS